MGGGTTEAKAESVTRFFTPYFCPSIIKPHADPFLRCSGGRIRPDPNYEYIARIKKRNCHKKLKKIIENCYMNTYFQFFQSFWNLIFLKFLDFLFACF